MNEIDPQTPVEMTPAERKRRIEAARILRGISQQELNRLVAADGLDKLAAGRVERGEIPLTPALRHSICRHLRVPEAWLREADVDVLVGYQQEPRGALTDDEIRRAAQLLGPQLLAAARELQLASEPAPQAPAAQDRQAGSQAGDV